ncbi:hypothetical protein D9599_28870 [Roseomonas sp. KE2513]|uniref:hypothetical protein n=1 Tax=Roseomonas sp. KE2513 TaxID=2479202 RepID=UPI0018DF73B4|nr:hypothetical protein [Roseomonas sp. KE2513]MBI0539525.1 hypothetical protein [Roseomonas sp. KE2513]
MPAENGPFPEDRAAAATIADLLEGGWAIHLFSAALSAGAMAALLLAPSWQAAIGPVAVLLAGLVETWMALRVRFDARCFRRIAEAADGPGLAGFDAALCRLGLMPESKAGRPLAPRIAGARRLLARQSIALLAQIGLAVLAVLAFSGRP